MISLLWARFFEKIDAHITERIVRFHDAMVERNQIQPPPHGFGLSGGADVAALRNKRILIASE